MFDYHEAIKAMHKGFVVKYVGTVSGNIMTSNGGSWCMCRGCIFTYDGGPMWHMLGSMVYDPNFRYELTGETVDTRAWNPEYDPRRMKTRLPEILRYRLIRTTRRLTFDIDFQAPRTIYTGDDDGEYYRFVASNKYEVISRSRMDIQTERIWLLGAKHNEEPRSGSMVFSSDLKAFNAHIEFIKALDEWAAHHGGRATRIS